MDYNTDVIRVTQHMGGWRIIEKATPQYWFHWPQLFGTMDAAEHFLRNHLGIEEARRIQRDHIRENN